MKRRAETAGGSPEEEPAGKAARAEGRPWDRRAGMIIEVKLRNFMCHESYTYRPNQRLNFLCGENGSGKSAVLTAIVFGLGGSARTSSRGSSNKGFIRTGQASAVVEVRLCNEGDRAYRPEVYGDSITVMRTVTNTSSTYKLKDSRGKPAVEKKVKEELDRILMSFNIQVDNPIAVLNQDTAKTFLFKCDPDKLYTFFMRATQLETCKADYNAAALERSSAETHLQEKQASLPELKRELGKWQKKYEFHQNLNVRKQDVKRKKGELSWAVVRDAELEAVEAEGEADESRKKIPKCQEMIDDHVTKEKELLTAKKDVEAEIQGMAGTFEALKARVGELKADAEQKRDSAKAAKKVHAELERKKERLGREVKVLTDEIAKLRSNVSDFEEKSLERRRAMEQLEAQVVALNAQIETTSNHSNHLRHNSREAEAAHQQAIGEVTRLKGKVRQSREEVAALQSSGTNRLAAFGRDMPRIVKEVESCRGFKRKPVGPLGAYINMREGCDEKLSRAVEQEIGGLVTAFLCDNSADQKTLYNLFQRLNIRSKPVIFTCQFTERRHNVESSKVRSDQYSTLIDLVDIEDPNVFNRVVDSASLERILFIPAEAEAQALLSDARAVPRNLLHANVPNYQYYPAPNYRSYYRQDQTRGLLKASMEELVGQRKEQLRVEEEAVKVGEARVKEAVEEKRKFDRLSKEEEDKVMRIQVEIRGLHGQITNYRNEEENEAPVDIAALEDDLQVKREAIETAEEQIEGERAKTNEVVENAKEAKRMFVEANDEYERKVEATGPKEVELANFEASIIANRKKVVYYGAKMDDYKKKFAEGEAVATEKRQAVEAAVNRAKEWSEEKMETRKKVDSLKKEIVKLEESLKRQEETQESREVVTAEYTRLKVVFDKSDGQVRTMTNTVEYLGNMLDNRKSGFKLILKMTSKNITRNFAQQLDARNYLGKLDFDHKEKTMLILVNPDSKASAAALGVFRDIRTLSGGEKSYSSVSLILALWNAMSPPFRVLDEFDVFMDAVNRRVSLKNIINYASEDRKYQFIFLTPLNTDNIEVGDDLKIIKLSKRAGN